MSQEISVSYNIRVVNGEYSETRNDNSNFDQTSQGSVGGIVSATMYATALPLGSVTTLGWCWLKNLDATLSVDWGIIIGGPAFEASITLKAGEFSLFRCKAGTVPAIKTSGGGLAKVSYIIWQD